MVIIIIFLADYTENSAITTKGDILKLINLASQQSLTQIYSFLLSHKTKKSNRLKSLI